MPDVKIGLETHVQLDTDTKLLCGCPNVSGDEPNTHVCEVCLGHPGSKPRLNGRVVEQAVKVSEALQCDVNEDIYFSRKTYFYPDMNKNYQVTQYEIPVGDSGCLEVRVGDRKKTVDISRLHVEEDPARLEHAGGSISDADYTLVDYNRAGTPLIEIVTEPVFRSPEEARAYLQQLSRLLEYLDIYEPGSEFSIKSDANISLEGGERVEVKNITGTAGIEKALNYEISRQRQLRKRGKEVGQETRSYNGDQEVTTALREKETEEDYGYIFEPDLTRQTLGGEFVDRVSSDIPELPHEKFQRFRDEYGLNEKLAEALVTDPGLADDFEKLAGEHDTSTVASLMTGDLKKVLNYHDLSYPGPLQLDWIEYVVELLEDDEISDRNAEMLLRELAEEPRDPSSVVEDQDLLKADESEIDSLVSGVIDDNPGAVEDYESGEEDAVNYLVGQVMDRSGGKADPKTAREKILAELE